MSELPKIESQKLKNHLTQICQPRDAFENPETLDRVQSYIEAAFLSYGYQVEKQAFLFQAKTFQNLIASRDFSAGPPELIIGAHFDSVPRTPGADDNGSGVAAMLEAAKSLASLNLKRRVHFAAFNLEEYGMIGSARYVEFLLKQFPGREFRNSFLGMISLEMVGFISRTKGSQQMPGLLKPFYPDTGNFLALVGEGKSAALLKKAKEAFSGDNLPVEALEVPFKGALFPAVRLSDHSPFWDAGLPALLVTDTSFFRNPHYHLASDTIETLDLDFLAKVTEGVIRLARSL
jgi:Zn-dependent M28 family amino/carboxypeptidase